LLGDALSKLEGVSESSESLSALTRAYYADQDPEIRSVLESEDALPNQPPSDLTKPVKEILDRIDIGYYEGDAAEIGSLELSKVVGVEAAFEVLNIDDPFAVAMGDSKSDLRVMRWLEETGTGIGAAPEHASQNVLDHVRSTDELVFDEGKADGILRTIYALNLFAESA
jgi:hydroxymethylpyrimidine pyrophosphatase-like HAD family hydrolase